MARGKERSPQVGLRRKKESTGEIEEERGEGDCFFLFWFVSSHFIKREKI